MIAVIDTETNWHDQVMSIGTVIVREEDLCPVEQYYHVLAPEYLVGGMYDDALCLDAPGTVLCSRGEALGQILERLHFWHIDKLFAYNAAFDRNHLPELRGFLWYDIMRIAAYRQTNPAIGPSADCCSTGRLKRGYGVEPMLRLLSGKCSYQETHNALDDALDELQIMRLLGRPIHTYILL